MENLKGYVHEVFGSFQGEGPYVGERHVFVRLSRCSLGCRYCDTPHSRTPQQTACLERGPGMGMAAVPNPVAVEDVVRAVMAQEVPPGLNSALCATGGEPLEQPDFLAAVLKALGGRLRVVLETNGTLPDALARVLPLVDVVSMDIKLPSVSGLDGLWEAHEAFLRTCSGKETVVKAVAAPDTPAEEVARAARLAAENMPDALFVIQPMTPGEGRDMPGGEWLSGLFKEAKRYSKNVRVIPQVHKILKVR